MSTLTAAMVLYNEELLIDLAIKSAKDFVDDFVIVDNGCTDRTIEVAKECIETWNLKAEFYEYEGTLRGARAFSFGKAEGDWIFLHDGDHVLQTEGKYSVLEHKRLINGRSLRCYRFPLVRLYYDYFHTQKDLQDQPPHKLLFSNKPKRWRVGEGTRNIPHSTAPTRVVNNYGVWNICIKRADRILERQYWRKWRHDNRPMPIRDYVIRQRNIYPKQFEKYAEWWMHGRIFLTRGFINPKVDRYGGYPALIQEEIDHSVNRTCFDTVESIRFKRQDSGLTKI